MLETIGVEAMILEGLAVVLRVLAHLQEILRLHLQNRLEPALARHGVQVE